METLGKDKKLKPWMTNGEDLEKELKRLGLRKEDLRLDRKPVMLDPENNLVDRVRIPRVGNLLFRTFALLL